MSVAHDRLSERLRELPSDVLAEILVRVTKRDSALKSELVALTSDSSEKARGVKHAIGGLRRTKIYFDAAEAKQLKTKLDNILAQIASVAEKSPSKAFELLCEFIATDSTVIDGVDDSTGAIGKVYSVAAPALAATIAPRCSDVGHVTKCLCIACADDEYGARAALVDALASSLPEEVLQALYNSVEVTVNSQVRKNGTETRHLDLVLRRILVALGDTDRYIVLCTHNKKMSNADILTLAQIFIDHDDYNSADAWLNKISGRSGVRHDRAFEMQTTVDNVLGRTDRVKEQLEVRFLANPCEETFLAVKEHLTKKESQAMINSAAWHVRYTDPLPVPIVQFLIDKGKGAEMERVVADYNFGRTLNTTLWTNLAEIFEKGRLPLGASVIYRALLDHFLDNSHHDSYHLAAYCYTTLWTLAPHVQSWRGQPTNDAYMASLTKRHFVKPGFWVLAEGTPKPPRVSQFKL